MGSEIKKTRPAIIVNEDALGILPLRIIIPLTDWKERYEIATWMVKIEPNSSNNLSKNSAADCFQVRSVSQQRFIRKIGNLDSSKMREIERALAIILRTQ